VKVLDVEQGSPEWRAARAGIATASEFAAIIAKPNKDGGEKAGRRNYRRQLVVERLTGQPKEDFQSAAMKQGTEREPDARAAYANLTGEWVQTVGFVRHDEIECGASPDGLIGDDGGLEIKCPEQSAHTDTLLDQAVPAEYVAQIQGNLWLTGRAYWDFVSFNPDFPPRMRLFRCRVLRDEKYIGALMVAVGLFMEEVRFEEAALRRLYPDPAS
jgi:putative phage-type endonuclease